MDRKPVEQQTHAQLVELQKALLEDQKKQTRYVKSTNGMMVFLTLLIILGIVFGCLTWLMGSGLV